MGTEPEARSGEGGRRELARRERELAALANRQHGILLRDQLLAAGIGVRTIRRRVAAGRLQLIHRSVYALGAGQVTQRGLWTAAVLACGNGALLSHRSAAALWGLMRWRQPVEVTAPRGQGRKGIVVHECGVCDADRTTRDEIAVTTVARTLFDLAEVVDQQRLERAWEEADRLRHLELKELEAVCARGQGRHALKPIRALMEAALEPVMGRSPLEERFAIFCREQRFPPFASNVMVLGREVDVLWPRERVIVELDGFGFHGHRAAFERDRTRDAALLVAGYRVLHITHLRLGGEPDEIAGEIRSLLRLGRSLDPDPAAFRHG